MKSKQHITFGTALALSALTAIASAPAASSAESKARNMAQHAELYVVNARLSDVINLIGNVTGSRIVQSDAIAGRVSQRHLSGDLNDILASLVEEHELDWFYFNGLYYVSAQREAVSRVIRLGYLSSDAAISALDKAGLTQKNLEVSEGSDGASLILSGAPRLIAFCEVIIENIPDVDPVVVLNKGIVIRRGISISSPSHTAANVSSTKNNTDEASK